MIDLSISKKRKGRYGRSPKKMSIRNDVELFVCDEVPCFSEAVGCSLHSLLVNPALPGNLLKNN